MLSAGKAEVAGLTLKTVLVMVVADADSFMKAGTAAAFAAAVVVVVVVVVGSSGTCCGS